MPLFERFELLELRRDDGIQTFHAREIATARPVQVHMFPEGESRETLSLLARLEHLPDAEWRRVVERGDYQGKPYVVTDRLAGYPGFREWLMLKTDPAERNASLDDQFRQLFDQDAETAALTVSPLAAPLSRRATVRAAGEEEDSQERDPRVAKSLVGIALGILAAILLLALIVAGLAFRRR